MSYLDNTDKKKKKAEKATAPTQDRSQEALYTKSRMAGSNAGGGNKSMFGRRSGTK